MLGGVCARDQVRQCYRHDMEAQALISPGFHLAHCETKDCLNSSKHRIILSWRNSMSRSEYTPVQKFLHWTVFVLVLCAYLITFGEDFYSRGSPERMTVWWLHFSLGLSLLAFVIWRLLARATSTVPPLPSSMTHLEMTAAKFAHHLLYALLVLIPVLGIWLAELRGNELSFFGLFKIPQFITPDRELAGSVKEVHGFLANAILVVAGLHALAALWHQFYKKDNVLKRMLP